MIRRTIYKITIKRKLLFSIFKLALLCLGAVIVLGALVFSTLFVYYSKDLPRPEKFMEKQFVQSTKIFDRTGETLLYELYGEEKREIIPLSEMPDILKKAVIAVEDANFYSHHGIDPKAIVRSLLADLRLRSATYGASTISQQLIRSTFLSGEKTLKRKVRELILALELERRYSKDQILEWYLNQVPFGINIYGVQSASKTFFGKPTKDLTLNEAACLAAMIKSPSYFSPTGKHGKELAVRKNYVLDRMATEKYITEEQAEQTKKEELKFSEVLHPIKAPHFVFYVQNYLEEKYGKDFLQKGGLKIYTTLNWNWQKQAEEIVKQGAKTNQTYRAYNAALVAIDPKTGEILTMVGSADWFSEALPKNCVSGLNCLFDPKVNVATYNIGRQPGSSFKPIVYATAFEKGYTDKYVVIDELTNFGNFAGKDYVPQNYDGRFRGPVTLRSALAQSLNIPSVKVLMYLAGLQDSVDTAKRMGITTLKDSSNYGPSLVLGGGEVKLLDMVSAYGVFATEGLRVPPISVIKITDANGNILEESKKTPKRVLKKETANMISSMLSDNEARSPIFGYTSSMYFKDYQVAAKTGTTTDYKDGWIIGYTPSVVAGVWGGNNDGTLIKKEPGTVVAGPIWRAFMDKVLPTLPKESLLDPNIFY